MQNLKQLLISFDQFIFCLIGTILSIFNHKIHVYADMTISAQSYRLEQRDAWYGKIMRICIDFLFRPFGKDHCKESYESEINNSHLPSDL